VGQLDRGRKLPCKYQFDSSSGFDTIPACDGRTDGRTHDDSTQRASKASRGKNRPIELVLVLLSRVMDWTAVGLPPECMTTVLVGVLRPRDDNDAGTEHADYIQSTHDRVNQTSKQVD